MAAAEVAAAALGRCIHSSKCTDGASHATRIWQVRDRVQARADAVAAVAAAPADRIVRGGRQVAGSSSGCGAGGVRPREAGSSSSSSSSSSARATTIRYGPVGRDARCSIDVCVELERIGIVRHLAVVPTLVISVCAIDILLKVRVLGRWILCGSASWSSTQGKRHGGGKRRGGELLLLLLLRVIEVVTRVQLLRFAIIVVVAGASGTVIAPLKAPLPILLVP